MDTGLLAIFSVVSTLYGIPNNLLPSLCWVETGHRSVYNNHDGKHPSIGMCQIKAASARQVGFKGDAKELMKPEVNIQFAGKYLRWQYDRYGSWSKAISAYNSGSVNSHGGTLYLTKVVDRMLVTPR